MIEAQTASEPTLPVEPLLPLPEPAERFLNRELSWLAFNLRVLAQAEDSSLPLLERLKFCAIYASNLDEFFMVRVAGLKDQVAAGVSTPAFDGRSPRAQLSEISDLVDEQARRLERVKFDELLPALATEGVELLDWAELSSDEQVMATKEFEERIFKVLTPLAVDPGHPFPYISNLSLNLAVLVTEPDGSRRRFARLKVPPSLPRFLELPGLRFVPLEQVIAAHLGHLFPGMEIIGGWPFRVTRNADLALDEDADDLLEAVELELRRRRFGRAIRLEVEADMPREVIDLLRRELDLDDADVFLYRGWLDASSYWQLQSVDRNDLKSPMTPGVPAGPLRELEGSRDLFERISRGDIFLHHPYESFSSSVSEFIRLAADDPDVLAIKITLYRTSGDSPIVQALIDAVEQGKQVAALVELKARFDEANNIGWAKRLEEAGVHVTYGLVGLKIHTKTILVVRNERDGVRQYCHIGTGNYNAKTARLYEDCGILTADPVVGEDLTQLFNYLTGYGRDVTYRRLLVAPTMIRPAFDALIQAEMEAPPGQGRIILKMNSLVDPRLIDRLYEAGRAGVQIDLIVRGICCLMAGVPGLSDNIRVRSLLGRNLEHSRIFYFAHGARADLDEAGADPVGNGGSEERFYLGSADLMPRNLDRRVEVLVRVDDDESQQRLREILDVNLADTDLAWEMAADGTYNRVAASEHDHLNTHDELERLAAARAEVVGDPGGRGVGSHRLPPERRVDRTDVKPIRAAGCMVYRRTPVGVEVLVIHRPHYGDWDFPKGKREAGETDLACAIRETEEEAGSRGDVEEELPSDRYQVRGREKIVRWWLMHHTDGSFAPNDEVDEARWLRPEAAAALLTYGHARRLLGYLPNR
jgi:polyphosphate kinase